MNIESRIKKLVNHIEKSQISFQYAFLSLGKPNIKANVKLLKNPRYLERDILKQCQKFYKKSGEQAKWVKVDLVTETENILFDQVVHHLIERRRNYIDYGITLDKFWNLTFLPEEINVNAFVRPSKKVKGEFILSEDNINNYLRKYTNQKKPFTIDSYQGKEITKFYTQGFILDENDVFELGDRGLTRGLRKVDNLHTEIDKLIDRSVDFLNGMMQENGKYIYGYFPHFDKNINFYNNLRHSSSTYALI